MIWAPKAWQSSSHRWVRSIFVSWSRNHLLLSRKHMYRNHLRTSNQPFSAISCAFLEYCTTFLMHSGRRNHFWYLWHFWCSLFSQFFVLKKSTSQLICPQKMSRKWTVAPKSILEMESVRFVDQIPCTILQQHSNSRRERNTKVRTFWYVYFVCCCKEMTVNIGNFILFDCLSVVGVSHMKSGLQSELISFLGSIYVLLLICCSFFVGKVAGKSTFSTHKNCEKVSSKNVENIKNELSALNTSKKWYDMPEMHNLSHRTVDPKLVDDSDRSVFFIIWGYFWINSRKSL